MENTIKTYKEKKDFIKKIKPDIKKQIKNISKNYKDKDLILNINDDINVILNIDFDFNFIDIKNQLEKDCKCRINVISIKSIKVYFNKQVYFYNDVDFKFNNLDFSNSIFNGNVNFSKNIFDGKVDFNNSIFNEEVDFNNTTFNGKVDFNNTTFNEKVDFNNTRFNKELSFSFSSFYKGSDFSGVTFNDNINFSYSKFQLENTFYNFNTNDPNTKEIKFNNIIFLNNDTILSITNENEEKYKRLLLNDIFFTNIIVNGKIELKNIEIKKLDFKGSIIYGGYINPVNFKVHKFANRESALFLKQQAYARNNVIDALEYKAKEIEKHKEDLIKDWQKNKDFKTFGDILSIELSSLYSDNGQNWIRALAMTIFVTAFCFTVFYMPDVFYIGEIFNEENYVSLYFSSYKNVFNNLIKYLIPTDYDLIKDYTKLYINYSNTPLCDILIYLAVKVFGVLVYFLGKVLFWYGSVQTVTAFRKFAKGA
ncbi:pentapeptide repeat-containing protein [Brachyspira pilosicoli]|uniref:pentapeptide repeat-containing protein n=1 Tax=Brachyspira pilosicoli TaxID=52584 RepID=UPI002543E03A|nr:pentapeptide repeat-containing protein [Brachyspira pilosicoli]WIH85992.1 pentapeptide repeat-containing protein [Brachyspira pilosicoli]